MLTVHKFTRPVIDVTGVETLSMPQGARILSVGRQRTHLCFWALCDTEQPLVERKVLVAGTGLPLTSTTARFIGTVQIPMTAFGSVLPGEVVWHCFEES